MNCQTADIVPFATKIDMNSSVAINSAVRVINLANRVFDFSFMFMIISFSIFKVIVIRIWIDIKLSKKPSESKFLTIFLNKSISL